MSLVLVDNFADEGEAEADSLSLIFVAVLGDLVEFFPDTVDLVGGNAGSVV